MTIYELKDVYNNTSGLALYASFNGARMGYIEHLKGKPSEFMLVPLATQATDVRSFNLAVGSYGIVIKEREVLP